MTDVYTIPLYICAFLLLVYVVTRIAAAAYFKEKQNFNNAFIRNIERNELQ